jgi:hypothetical protein
MNLYRHLFSLITPLLSTKSKSAYGLSLSDTMVHAYDILGWGETSHVRRVLQVI